MGGQLHEGMDLADHEDAENALNLALQSCSHMSPVVFFEEMAELVGQFVREGVIARQQVHSTIDAVLPPDVKKERAYVKAMPDAWEDDVLPG